MKRNIYTLLLACFGLLLNTTAQENISGNFIHNGIQRDYVAYLPASYTGNTAVPLVLNLHGYSSTNGQQQLYTNFNAVADTANFIIVYPNGTYDNGNQRFWNAWGLAQPDDVGFLSTLIDTLAGRYNIDLNRVYSTGMSNGGIMSYTLACSLSNRITAVASVTGSMVTSILNNCEPWRPVPVMEIHGTADATVPYTGGGGLGFVNIDSLMAHWVEFNNCNPTPAFANVPDIDAADGCTAEHYVWSGGDLGSSVELYKIIDGSHTWPDAVIDIGVTNRDINASNEIWRFFKKYSLDMFATGVKETLATKGFSAYPNPSNSNFTLKFDTEGKKTISVYNAWGSLIKTTTVNATQTQLDIETPGFYFISVNQGGKLFIQKVVRN